MQFSAKLFAIAALFTAVATASPVVEAVSARAPAARGVTVCHDINFGGRCVDCPVTQGCHNVSPQDNDKITSIRVNREGNRGVKCIFYQDNDCRGRTFTVEHDFSDLRKDGFNDVISSFQCW